MPGAVLSPWFAQQFFDNNGVPLVGGLIYTYAAGTSTPQAAYTDSSGTVPQTNPIVLDGSGRAPIWLLNINYKFVIQTSAMVTLYTVDNVNPMSIGAGSITTAMLADGAVTIPKIADANVTTAKIADGAVTAAKLAAGVGFLPDIAVGYGQTYATWAAGIAAASANQSIYVRTGNYVENVVINKPLHIVGSGGGCVIAGNLTFAAGSDESSLFGVKVLGVITINSGVSKTQIALPTWVPNKASLVDNGTDSLVNVFSEV